MSHNVTALHHNTTGTFLV